ncbi:MAG: glutamate racemase, partial [candidate division WOR-3 bacterium]|nr:glutamate racemase [candidate division WOR-3 bacterium]
TKSSDTIKRFALQDAEFLMNRDVKIMIIACHTASAIALEDLQKKYSIPIIGVIEPGAQAVVKATKNKKVGVIATQATILAGAYERAIKRLDQEIEIIAKATPLFVSLAEEGWINNPITYQVAKIYLQPLAKEKIDSLLLGCTHYPLLKRPIKRVFEKKVKIVDASLETALAAQNILNQHRLNNPQNKYGTMKFYFSDLTPNLSNIGRMFIGQDLMEVYRTSLAENS